MKNIILLLLLLLLLLRGLSPRKNYSNCRFSAKLVPPFPDRGCHVVCVTDPYGRILGFTDRSRYLKNIIHVCKKIII
jgi:hypothetical protein